MGDKNGKKDFSEKPWRDKDDKKDFSNVPLSDDDKYSHTDLGEMVAMQLKLTIALVRVGDELREIKTNESNVDRAKQTLNGIGNQLKQIASELEILKEHVGTASNNTADPKKDAVLMKLNLSLGRAGESLKQTTNTLILQQLYVESDRAAVSPKMSNR